MSATQVEIRFTADQSLLELIEKAKGLLAHRLPNASLGELIAQVTQICIQKLEPPPPKPPGPEGLSAPASKAQRGKKSFQLGSGKLVLPSTNSQNFGAEVPADSQSESHVQVPNQTELQTQTTQQTLSQPKKTLLQSGDRAQARSHSIPNPIKRIVYHRDQGRCTFLDELTGQRCKSCYRLEYNHRIPVAQGGPTTVENLHLVCKSHNLALAIRDFGMKKMAPFLK